LSRAARLVYVTPGGAGLLSGRGLGQSICRIRRYCQRHARLHVVTITTSAAHNLNPGNPGTVLISGLPAGSTKQDRFQRIFFVGQVLDATHFQYFQADKDDTSTCTIRLCRQFWNSVSDLLHLPLRLWALPSIQSREAPFSPTPCHLQPDFFHRSEEPIRTRCRSFSEETGPASAGVLELGAAEVAFQPFTNTAVSFNPKTNEVSLLDPSLLQRPAIVTTGQNGLAALPERECW